MDKKKLKKLTTAAVVFTAVVFLAAAGWFIVLPAVQYNNAVSLYENDEFLKAAEIFEKLGNFKDAEELLLDCNYSYALDAYNSGDYAEAAEMFADLGDYEESPEYLLESENNIKYIEATGLMDNKEYEKAGELFSELGDFKDSAELSVSCKTEQSYIDACSLMESGNNEDAKLLFESIPNYKDSNTLALICSYKTQYIEAKEKADAGEFSGVYTALNQIENNAETNGIELAQVADAEEFTSLKNESYKYYCYDNGTKYYDEGKYYSAYTWFNAAEIYDSAEKAEACIQPFVSGEIYSNPDYSADEVTITFRSDKDYTKYECIKIVTTKDLVSVVVVPPGQSVRVSIPEGVYSIVGGSGTVWFGSEDYFGEDGHYYKVEFSKDVCFAGDVTRKLYLSIFSTTIEINESGGDGNLTSKEISYYSFLTY